MRTIFLGMDQAADKLRTGNTGDNPFKKKRVARSLHYTHMLLLSLDLHMQQGYLNGSEYELHKNL